MPLGLWQALQQARHQVETVDGGYRAHNPGNRQRIGFQAEGVAVTPAVASPAWQWGLVLTGYGTPEVIAPVAPPELIVDGQRVEYRRGPVTEWYLNKPVGLEQGFTLAASPHPDAERLVLAMTLRGGLEARWQREGKSIAFHTRDGSYALSCRDLEVIDAAGNHLPARLALRDDSLEIQVAVVGARWPIVVDPLVVNEQKVTAQVSDAAADDWFGFSVALSGDTDLIGASGDDDGGSAYTSTLPCGFGLDVASGPWAMVASPCSPTPPGTVASAYGNDLPGTYGSDWILYERDAAADVYVPLASDDPVDPGAGTWLRSFAVTRVLNDLGIEPLLLKDALALLPAPYPGAGDRVIGDLDLL